MKEEEEEVSALTVSDELADDDAVAVAGPVPGADLGVGTGAGLAADDLLPRGAPLHHRLHPARLGGRRTAGLGIRQARERS